MRFRRQVQLPAEQGIAVTARRDHRLPCLNLLPLARPNLYAVCAAFNSAHDFANERRAIGLSRFQLRLYQRTRVDIARFAFFIPCNKVIGKRQKGIRRLASGRIKPLMRRLEFRSTNVNLSDTL